MEETPEDQASLEIAAVSDDLARRIVGESDRRSAIHMGFSAVQFPLVWGLLELSDFGPYFSAFWAILTVLILVAAPIRFVQFARRRAALPGLDAAALEGRLQAVIKAHQDTLKYAVVYWWACGFVLCMSVYLAANQLWDLEPGPDRLGAAAEALLLPMMLGPQALAQLLGVYWAKKVDRLVAEGAGARGAAVTARS